MGNTISYHESPVELSLGSKGTLRGVQLDDKACRYAGVPYALPPTGEHRWRKPRPLPASFVYGSAESPYDATKFKPVCPQKAFHVGAAEGDASHFSEDCLVVNIWTPVAKAGATHKPWPVMLWLHGGWFQMGDPSQEAGMDASELIATGGLNAVFVAIGYRLNVFGFLAGEALRQESGGVSAGNFGLWDQRLAAEWVHENIALFGGDPSNVTLAGRSAGAYSVEAQMLHEFRAPGLTTPLFRRAFMDSNAIPAQPKSLADTQAQFDELCALFAVDASLAAPEKLARLRQVPAMDLVGALSRLQHHTFRPVTDELFLHSGMVDFLESRAFADAFRARGWRLLIGEVRNEETLYSTYNAPTEPTREALRQQVANYYASDVTDRVLQCYELPTSADLDDWKRIFGQIVSDGQVRAPSRALAKHLVDNGVSIRDVWRYQIAYRLSFIDETVAPKSFGVAHAMDKPFWNYSICYGPTPPERRLMDDWIKILVAFVNDDASYSFGTDSLQQLKTATPDCTIEVRPDERWDELLRIGHIFAGQQA